MSKSNLLTLTYFSGWEQSPLHWHFRLSNYEINLMSHATDKVYVNNGCKFFNSVETKLISSRKLQLTALL